MVKALSPRHAKQPTAAGRFALNALSLIAVNLFMRTVGVAFNAYLAGRAGGEVMGLYSLLFAPLVYPAFRGICRRFRTDMEFKRR